MMFCDVLILLLVFHSALPLKKRCVCVAVSFASNCYCWCILYCVCPLCPPYSQILPPPEITGPVQLNMLRHLFTAIFRGGNQGMESGRVLPGLRSWDPNSGSSPAAAPALWAPVSLPSLLRADQSWERKMLQKGRNTEGSSAQKCPPILLFWEGQSPAPRRGL